MSAPNVAVRVDAGAEIGTGHFMRCLTLAEALGQRGAQVRFICRDLSAYLSDRLAMRGIELRSLSAPEASFVPDELAHASWLGASQAQDAAATIAALAPDRWDWLVVDHYAIDARWHAQLRPVVSRILVVDDIADRHHDCDLLLDQNVYDDMALRYVARVPASCGALLGPRYALLRDEFRQLRGRARPRSGQVRRLLVFFGGVDQRDYTGRAIEALASLPGLDVDVVIGAGHPHRERIEASCAARGFRCHVQTDRMAQLMLEADLAIGAGGSATWERCCLGLPAIVFAVADNQVAASEALARRGVIHLAGNDRCGAEIVDATTRVLTPAKLAEMSRRALALVDGQGVDRVVEAMDAGART